jgi:hypothetical protein
MSYTAQLLLSEETRKTSEILLVVDHLLTPDLASDAEFHTKLEGLGLKRRLIDISNPLESATFL